MLVPLLPIKRFYILIQARKQDAEQGLIADVLPALPPGSLVDALVVGCGPAGIYLAAQMAEKGLNVGLVGEPHRSSMRFDTLGFRIYWSQ